MRNGIKQTALRTYPFEVADSFNEDEDISCSWTVVLEESDPRDFMEALGAVARARGGIDELARKTDSSSESLRSTLSSAAEPDFGVALKVMRSLGIGVCVKRHD